MFIHFIKIHDKDPESVKEVITSKLERNDLDLNACRGYTSDNTVTMSGTMFSVQEHISHRNLNIIFVNCDNYSLNLVKIHGASVEVFSICFMDILFIVQFFLQLNDTVEEIEWDSRDGCKAPPPHTKWNIRRHSAHVVKTKLGGIAKFLKDMAKDTSASVDTINDTSFLLHSMQTFIFLESVF